MIKLGQKKKARYWGKFEVEKVVTLSEPVNCFSQEKGHVEFMPTLVKIHWENSPSQDKNEFWFPYWVKIDGKEKYGQFAPMIGKKALCELLQKAIGQDFFDKDFLKELKICINDKLLENK